jgi:hypothetical protein
VNHRRTLSDGLAKVRHGKLREGAEKTALRGVWSAEGKWSLTLESTNAVPERFGFSGAFGWPAERGRVGQLPEALVAVLSMTLDPQSPLRLESQLTKLAPPRNKQLGERQAKVLEGETASGMKAILTFDAATGLLLRFNDTTFDDYREAGGVLIPFAVTVRQGTQACFERIENNVSLDMVNFDPPA